MSDDYQQFGEDGECRVMVHQVVSSFLNGETANDQKNVGKIKVYLERLNKFGLQGVKNTEQFKREGKFSSGSTSGGDIAVWAIKAHQIRVYGGFVNHNGVRTFFCVEGARKKKDKADRAQLKRVAKALGEING